MSVASVALILGGRKSLKGGTAERIDLMKLSEKGVNKDALLRLAKYLDLSLSQMAELLPVTAFACDTEDDPAIRPQPPLQPSGLRAHPPNYRSGAQGCQRVRQPGQVCHLDEVEQPRSRQQDPGIAARFEVRSGDGPR